MDEQWGTHVQPWKTLWDIQREKKWIDLVVVEPTRIKETYRIQIQFHVHESLPDTKVYVKDVRRRRHESAKEQYYDRDPY